jgi:hypothetical protein
MMISSLSNSTKARLGFYTAVLLLLIVLRIHDGPGPLDGLGQPAHADGVYGRQPGAVCGSAGPGCAYYTKRSSAYFYIGSGFIGAGLLDAYHAMRSVSLSELLAPTAVSLDMWQWNPSSTFLGIFIAGSWLIWQRDQRHSGQKQDYLIVLLVAVVSLFSFSLIPQPPLASASYLVNRLNRCLNHHVFLGGADWLPA